MGSRIIAVCDSINAMLSDRPYRKPLSPEVCREEIAVNSGVMLTRTSWKQYCVIGT